MNWRSAWCEVSPLDETLEQVKRRIRSEYMGVAGIHGVGLRREQNAVCIYTHGTGGFVDTDLRREIEEKAKPFSVVVIEEDPPMITAAHP